MPAILKMTIGADLTVQHRMNSEGASSMREITLKEYEKSSGLSLSSAERDTLLSGLHSITIEPVPGTEGTYHLTPGSVVGAIEVDGLSVVIEPKIGIVNLLSMACYAIGKVKFDRETFAFREEHALPDILALALAVQAHRAFSHGLLHGYLVEEQALLTVRGRVRFAEQVGRRLDFPMPVELRYDEFTGDILPNRLVKAATHRLARTPLRSQGARRGLGWVAGMLADVSLREFPPAQVPEVPFDRLNEHYRGVVTLSRLILRHGAFESERGGIRASAFLMDMDVVFQEFLTQALREQLGASPRTLRSDRELEQLTLDHGRRVTLKPDLTWWDGPTCTFVGDAKYKNLTGRRVPNGDLYQMLSYATALDLPGGLLVYAQGEVDDASYDVRHGGKRLDAASLNIAGTLDEALKNVQRIAKKVVLLREEARSRGT